MSQKKRGLGRGLGELGLDELLSQASQDVAVAERPPVVAVDEVVAVPSLNQVGSLSVDLLVPGRYQPRKHFSKELLNELSESIRTQGVIQPIIVRKVTGGSYEIIAGERRWRAAQLAGLTDIPAIIRDLPDEAAMAIALIENIQRQDLNVIEEAQAMHRLIEEFAMTHQQVADVVGKSRAAVSNLLRLLNLRAGVRELLEEGRLEMGHARALLSLEGNQQTEIADQVVMHGLSVRETEDMVRKAQQLTTSNNSTKKNAAPIDPSIRQLQTQLSDKLGAKVGLRHNAKGKGKLTIAYNSIEELDGILERCQLAE